MLGLEGECVNTAMHTHNTIPPLLYSAHNAAGSPPEGIEHAHEAVWVQLVVLGEDAGLLQCHGHPCAVLGTLAGGEPTCSQLAAQLGEGQCEVW